MDAAEAAGGLTMAGRRRSSKHLNAKRWRQQGFLSLPDNDKQGELALSGRDFIERLTCVDEVRLLLAQGRTLPDVVRVIQQEKREALTVTFATLRRYLGLYRRFFISPLEALRAGVRAEMTHEPPQTVSLLGKAMVALPEKIKEVEQLEELAEIQMARIRKARETEANMGGFLMPNLYKDVEATQKTLVSLANLKSDLGYLGYMRVPKVFDINAHLPPVPTEALTEEEKKGVLAFGQSLMELIEMAEREDGTFVANGNGKEP
jgi:hypothetical protein